MPFSFHATHLSGVVIIDPLVFDDERGFFFEAYRQSDFVAGIGVEIPLVQENHSRSRRGVLRGLHYQRAPHEQGKLIRVISGEVFDVAVDIREWSPSYGQWVSVVLSASNRRLVYIPPGYAHGFCVLSGEAEVIYKTTAEYAPAFEQGIRWNDPSLGITWPVESPIVSERDRLWPELGSLEYRGAMIPTRNTRSTAPV